MVILVGKRDLLKASWRCFGIDKQLMIALQEASPFEIRRDPLGCICHITVHCLLSLGLTADVLVKGAHGLLYGFDDVGFELLEGLFDGNQILPVVIFLQNLSMKVMVYGTLKDVWVIVGIDLAARCIERCCVLTKEFDVLLSVVPRLVDFFGALIGSTGQFFVFMFYLRV